MFLEKMSRYSDGTKIALYIHNSEGLQGLNGVPIDVVLTGMLESANIEQVDMISPFNGALLDRVCA